MLSGCHPSNGAVCIFQNISHLAQHVVHYTFVDQKLLPSHLAPALLPILRHDLPQISRPSILAISIPATIHNKGVSAMWLMYLLSAGYYPKDLDVSSRCSSTDRVYLRLTILLRALRHSSTRIRIWMMSNFVLCWLHHCACVGRSKREPITSLSLCKKKLGVKFI